MRRCATCRRWRSVRMFTRDRSQRDGLSFRCRPCHNEVLRRRTAARQAYLNRVKLERGCAVCGYREHPAALQFHHRDRRTKVALVPHLKACSWPRLLAEIAKCDVLCANHHAIETAGRITRL